MNIVFVLYKKEKRNSEERISKKRV